MEKPYCSLCLHPTEMVQVRNSFSHEFGIHSWIEKVSRCCGEGLTTRLDAIGKYLIDRKRRERPC